MRWREIEEPRIVMFVLESVTEMFVELNSKCLHFLPQKKSKKATETLTFKRPEGMHREVYALLYSDKKYVFPYLKKPH